MQHRIVTGVFHCKTYCRVLRKYRWKCKIGLIDMFAEVRSQLKDYWANMLLLFFFISCKILLNNNDYHLILMILLLLSFDIETNPGPEGEMSIFNWNVRSIRNKMDYLKDISEDYDLLCLTETHLDTNIPTSDVQIDGFSLYRKDRNFAGGGILIYTSDLLYSKRRTDIESNNYEMIWLEVIFKNSKTMIGVLYRPPNENPLFWNYLKFSIDKAQEATNNIIITGDINVNLLNELNNHPLKDIMNTFNLSNTIKEPTRPGTRSNTLLDPVIITDTISCISSSVLDIDRSYSDHNASVCHISIPHTLKNVYKRDVWLYKKGDYDKFNRLILECDWANLLHSCQNVDLACEAFTTKFIQFAKQCIPTKTITVRPNDKPWMSSELRKEIKIREKFYKKYKKNNSVLNLNNFKKQRNKVNNMKKFARVNFYENINGIIDHSYSNDPKSYWKLINRLIKQSGTSTTIPPLIDNMTGSIIYNEDDKANLLNKYFCTISNIEDGNIDTPEFMCRTNASFGALVVNQAEIVDVIKNLKLGKASGCDDISHHMLKYTSESVAIPLSILFNMSLTKTKFPILWKRATVIPLFKKGDKHIVSNYRPVSLISCVGKVLERVVFKHMYNFLINNNLFYQQQYGFLPKHTTVYQLIEMYETICKALEEKQHTCLIFCDISKAFDRVWHRGLIKKLEMYGFKNEFLLWLKSYISNRQQLVLIKDSKSTYDDINAGVPQGSVLGPLLFLIYINDIADNLNSLARLFADDTSLSYSSQNIQEIELNINQDLNKLNVWSTKWLTMFNPNKTELLFISNSWNGQNINIQFNGVQLESMDSHRHLGVLLSKDAKWTSHINSIYESCMKKVNVMRKLKYILNKSTLLKIFKCFILPVLEYACELWDGCSQLDKQKLENVQLEAARIACGLPIYCNKESVYFESQLEPLENRRERRKLTMFYKMHNHLVPQTFENLLPPLVANISNYPLRNRDNYSLTNYRLATTEKSFIPSTTRLWNSLDIEIRNKPTLNSFKSALMPKLVKHPCLEFTGNRKYNILHTRIRHNCSTLNYDLFRCNLIENAFCECGNPCENAFHYFLDCPLYLLQRRTLFHDLAFLNDITLEIILFGSSILSPENNDSICRAVQRYIRDTQRF